MKTGLFKSVEEVIHDALAVQTSEAEWLIDNRVAVNKKIARGVAHARLQRRKTDSQAGHKRG